MDVLFNYTLHLEAAAPGMQLGVNCCAQGHFSSSNEGGETSVNSLHCPDLSSRFRDQRPFWSKYSKTRNRDFIGKRLAGGD